MKLNPDQIAAYQRDGFVQVPDLFSAEEIGVVQREVPRLLEDGRGVILETDAKTHRSVLNAHLFNDPVDRLCRHKKVIGPVMQIVESAVYILQAILNVKRAYDGAQWQWHQDYPTYQMDDKMPESRAVNVLIFVDDVNDMNGPFMMVPGSQTHQTEIPDVDDSVTTYPHGRYPDVEWMKPIMERNGIVASTGKAGTVVFMDVMTVHGSGVNMSPWHRSIMSLTLNSVENAATGTVRGESICHDYTPITPVSSFRP